MRDRWIDDHVGGEASVRPEFEAALGDTLQSAWRQPVGSSSPRPSGPSPRVRAMIWAAAAAVILVGGVVLLTNGGTSRVTSTTDEASVSTTLVPATAVAVSTTVPDTTEFTTTTGSPQTTVPPALATTAAQRTVLDYLMALAEKRYEDAAKLLGEGGLALEERSDLRPFVNADSQIPDLATSLREWCEFPSLCQAPIRLSGTESNVAATFSVDGVERTTTFVGTTFEGLPLVTGLPPQLPAGVSLADTVQCPTELVKDTAYADLDGDGWYETLIAAEGLSGDFTLIWVCGSPLSTSALSLPVTPELAPPTRILPLDVEDDGREELLVASFDPEDFGGPVIRYRDGALIPTGQTVAVSAGRGEGFGCVDLDGDGVRDLVNYKYTFVGGTYIANSTAMEYTATGAAGASSSGRLALPDSADDAFRLMSGYCGNRPTLTG